MLKPDNRTLEALTALEGNHSFEVVLAWLRECRDAELNLCGYSVADVALRQAQGAYQRLAVIVASMEGARATLRKRQESPLQR